MIASTHASTLHLPPGEWVTVLDCLCARFPAIGRPQWLDRMQRGRVTDGQGRPIDAGAPYRAGLRVHYYREVAAERRIPFQETVLHADDHLVVADKPHFLPVTPSGGFVQETLLARLIRRLDNPQLVPLHRIDRGTAGLVLFSAHPATRSRYQALFPERRIAKRYEALAPAMPQHDFPLLRRTRLQPGEPFFRMREVPGEPNSETRIEVLQRGAEHWHYALYPHTGKKHQLRVQMAALGAPILNDDFYPDLQDEGVDDDYARPLKLLAQGLAFIDPLSGEARSFRSGMTLQDE
jgi:tRNA pseudouridine32 synthase/23S rRNA pseudouridine746 synthase